MKEKPVKQEGGGMFRLTAVESDWADEYLLESVVGLANAGLDLYLNGEPARRCLSLSGELCIDWEPLESRRSSGDGLE